jgi:hypothetical protein
VLPPARATPIVPGHLASVPSTDDASSPLDPWTSLLGPSFNALEQALRGLAASFANTTPRDLGSKGRSHKNQTSPESSRSKGYHEPTASRMPSEPDDFAKARKGAPMPGRVVAIEAGNSRSIPTAEPNRRSSDARREGDAHRRNERDRRPVSPGQRPAASGDAAKMTSIGVPPKDHQPHVPSIDVSADKARPKKQLRPRKHAKLRMYTTLTSLRDPAQQTHRGGGRGCSCACPYAPRRLGSR